MFFCGSVSISVLLSAPSYNNYIIAHLLHVCGLGVTLAHDLLSSTQYCGKYGDKTDILLVNLKNGNVSINEHIQYLLHYSLDQSRSRLILQP